MIVLLLLVIVLLLAFPLMASGLGFFLVDWRSPEEQLTDARRKEARKARRKVAR